MGPGRATLGFSLEERVKGIEAETEFLAVLVR